MLFTDGARREINVKSHITSEELFQHIIVVSGFGDEIKLEQWIQTVIGYRWKMVKSAKYIQLADGAKFRVVRMCTVSLYYVN